MIKERSGGMIPDHAGTHYDTVLDYLHKVLKPKSYLEIGVCNGLSLRFARCVSVGIDPEFRIDATFIKDVLDKPGLFMFQMSSDDFFAAHSPTSLLGRPIDMAFLDGMHRCEYLLRDFVNTEKHCRPNSVIVLHDCLPLEVPMTSRRMGTQSALAQHREGWWTGDVWRAALLLRRRRPDLEMTVLDAAPTGLILVTNLDPSNSSLKQTYRACVREMMSWTLEEIGFRAFYDEMGVEPTSEVLSHEALTARFWL